MDKFLKCPYCGADNRPITTLAVSTNEMWDVCDSCGLSFSYDVKVYREYRSYKDKSNEEN